MSNCKKYEIEKCKKCVHSEYCCNADCFKCFCCSCKGENFEIR